MCLFLFFSGFKPTEDVNLLAASHCMWDSFKIKLHRLPKHMLV